jgi:GNAT superfamily N-acetyltransferase
MLERLELTAFQVRRFSTENSADEESVRRICFDTALFGGPMGPFFGDRWLVTEAILGCHIRGEPESLFIAEANGEVAGYLAGSLDTRRLFRRCAAGLALRLLGRAIFRVHFLRPRSWMPAYAAIRYAITNARMRRPLIENYPATFHINLDERFRGAGIGTALVAAFLAAANNVRGVHISTASPAGKQFFSKLGFETASTALAPRILAEEPREMWVMTLRLPSARVLDSSGTIRRDRSG